jgi:hypothetical protein
MDWKPLTFDDKSRIDAALRQAPMTLSDYNFTNLWMWQSLRNYEIANVDNFLCIRFTSDGKTIHLYPIGLGSRRQLIATLSAPPNFTMRAVPEAGIDELRDLPLSIHEEPEHFDYIYSYEALLNLSGNQYQPKRNFIHQFESRYAYEYHPLSAELIPAIKIVEEKWLREHPHRSENMDHEHDAVMRALDSFEALKLLGGALLVDGSVVAYTFAEYITEEMLLIHVEKALHGYKGGYQTVNQQLLKHLKVVPFVNREEDLGVEQLAHAKHSYHPVRLDKKFLLQVC